MIARLDFLVRFWELSVRQATSGHPLIASEQRELLSLLPPANSNAHRLEAAGTEFPSSGLHAQLRVGETNITVEVSEVSPEGVLVACDPVVPTLVCEGAHLTLLAADPVGGVEYVLPCKVTGVNRGTLNTLALTIDGIPSRKSFFALEGAPHRSSSAA